MELQFASTASRIVGAAATPDGFFPGRPAHVLTAIAQAMYSPFAMPREIRIWLSAGEGLVRHTGDAYAPYGSPTELASAFGAGAAIPIARHLNAAIGMSTLVYYIDVSDSTGTSLQHGLQVDPLFHAGLTWGW